MRPKRAVLFCLPAADRVVWGMGLKRIWKARGVRPVSLRFVGLPEPRTGAWSGVLGLRAGGLPEGATDAGLGALVGLTGGTKPHSIGLYKAATG